MKLYCEQLNPHACRSYLVGREGSRDVILIDPVLEHLEEYRRRIEEQGLKLLQVADSHTHADHISGAAALEDVFAAEARSRRRLKLITRRAVTTHNSWTHNHERFIHSGTNYLYMHPEDAERAGLQDGDIAFTAVPNAELSASLARGELVLLEAQGRALLGRDPSAICVGDEARLERRLDDRRIEVTLHDRDTAVVVSTAGDWHSWRTTFRAGLRMCTRAGRRERRLRAQHREIVRGTARAGQTPAWPRGSW